MALLCGVKVNSVTTNIITHIVTYIKKKHLLINCFNNKK